VGVLLTGGIGPGLYVASALAAGIAGGVASYWLIERPLLSSGRRLIGRE
jgi:hypothetical protein